MRFSPECGGEGEPREEALSSMDRLETVCTARKNCRTTLGGLEIRRREMIHSGLHRPASIGAMFRRVPRGDVKP